ncbi:MAG: hypothetical protein PF495_02830, partial [Spirochaetales bacterium]|nr:hypothetical protein [Spirochaetales bacterium]
HQAGFTDIVCTPHLHDPFVETKTLNIRDSFFRLNSESKKYGITLHLGSELYLGTVPGKYIPFLHKFQIVEADIKTEPLYLLDRIFDLQMSGLCVILAHVERYAWFSMGSKSVNRMREMGVLFQVNAGSLHNKFVLQLIKEGWVDFIASDNHGFDRGPIDFKSWKSHSEINERSKVLLGIGH